MSSQFHPARRFITFSLKTNRLRELDTSIRAIHVAIGRLKFFRGFRPSRAPPCGMEREMDDAPASIDRRSPGLTKDRD
jgi:hypothetical protein